MKAASGERSRNAERIRNARLRPSQMRRKEREPLGASHPRRAIRGALCLFSLLLVGFAALAQEAPDFGEAARPLAPEEVAGCMKALKGSDLDQANALRALQYGGENAVFAVPSITGVLLDKGLESVRRSQAAETLGAIGGKAASKLRIPQADTTDGANGKGMEEAARAFASDNSLERQKIEGNFDPAARALLKVLKEESESDDPDEERLAWKSARSLGQLEWLARIAVADLANVVDNKRARTTVRVSAADALGRIASRAVDEIPGASTEVAVMVLGRQLERRGENSELQSGAAVALKEFGFNARSKIGVISERLSEPIQDLAVYRSFVEAFRDIAFAVGRRARLLGTIELWTLKRQLSAGERALELRNSSEFSDIISEVAAAIKALDEEESRRWGPFRYLIPSIVIWPLIILAWLLFARLQPSAASKVIAYLHDTPCDFGFWVIKFLRPVKFGRIINFALGVYFCRTRGRIRLWRRQKRSQRYPAIILKEDHTP
jgi:hypothetical protein